MEPLVHTIHEPVTGTWQYIVADPETKTAVIIDPVLDYNKDTGVVSTTSANTLIEIVMNEGYMVQRILETHAHADHLSAARYLQNVLPESTQGRPCVCIGKRISEVQKRMCEIYNIPLQDMKGAFDDVFEDDQIFPLGSIAVKVIHLPGHTPDHIGYIIGSKVFTGDSIFNPDVGSARCDFPGGSATQLYSSMQKLFSLPGHYELYTGHDYPPTTREPAETAVPFSTVDAQKAENKHAKLGTAPEDFISWRSERDSTLSAPKLMHHAMHVNIRGGRLPAVSSDDFKLAQVPANVAQVAKG